MRIPTYRTLTYQQHLDLCAKQELEAEKAWYQGTEVEEGGN